MIDPDYKNRDAAMESANSPVTIEYFRKMVDNKDYIDAAIERIALVLSDEILSHRNYKERRSVQ
jgi:hypothetical protein